MGRPTLWGNPFRVIESPLRKGVYRVVLSEVAPKLIDILLATCQFEYQDKWDAQAAAVECYEKLHGIHRSQAPNNAGNLFCEMARFELSKYDNLSCWCEEGSPCHADVLVDIISGWPEDWHNKNK